MALGGPSGGPDSIAEKGRFGGGMGEGGGGPKAPLPIDLDGDAVCARGGGGAGAGFSGSAPTYKALSALYLCKYTSIHTFLFTHFLRSLS